MVKRTLQQNSVWDPLQLVQAFSDNGIRPVHAVKLWSHLIRYPSAHWHDVPDLPKAAGRLLDEQFSKFTTKVVDCQCSGNGETTKLLLELQDGMQIEAVIMHYDTTGRFAADEALEGNVDEPSCSSAASCAGSTATGITGGGKGHRRATLCVSSQVGCQMGCTFCATGTMGLKGNLTAGEIVEQLVHANAISKIRNVVFMGMGEPLNNYEAVRAAIGSMVDPRQWGLARQRVTVSTVGVVNRVKQLGQDLPGIGLALSLHAPNQDLRIQIVPSAKAYHIDRLIESVAAYQHLSKQHIFVEYVLLSGVNDGVDHAHQLGALLSGLKVLLNLIPWNPVLAAKEAHNYSAPTQEAINQFQAIVRTHYRVPTTVRQEKGQDIAGACGQLALEKAAARQRVGEGIGVSAAAAAGVGGPAQQQRGGGLAVMGSSKGEGGGLLGGVAGSIGGLLGRVFSRVGSTGSGVLSAAGISTSTYAAGSGAAAQQGASSIGGTPCLSNASGPSEAACCGSKVANKACCAEGGLDAREGPHSKSSEGGGGIEGVGTCGESSCRCTGQSSASSATSEGGPGVLEKEAMAAGALGPNPQVSNLRDIEELNMS